ncbi:hypothetical protein ACS0TY_000412 [Phlomoides rotata]
MSYFNAEFIVCATENTERWPRITSLCYGLEQSNVDYRRNGSTDVRESSHIVQTNKVHRQEVCGLKWSASGQQLASGGNDNPLHILDRLSQWLHRLEEHTFSVKALAWCPFKGNLLASGEGDGYIKFFNTHSGACQKLGGSQRSALSYGTETSTNCLALRISCSVSGNTLQW